MPGIEEGHVSEGITIYSTETNFLLTLETTCIFARLLREEEHDLLQSRCLRQQTTIAELRACLQHERDGMQSTLSSLPALEPMLPSIYITM